MQQIFPFASRIGKLRADVHKDRTVWQQYPIFQTTGTTLPVVVKQLTDSLTIVGMDMAKKLAGVFLKPRLGAMPHLFV